jgi:hypothetical protein
MEGDSEMQDTRGETLPTLVSWSMWGVSYAMVAGVRLLGTIAGQNGRLGWRLDNEGGKAKHALDEWRSGEAVVNGRALIDCHNILLDDIRHLK